MDDENRERRAPVRRRVLLVVGGSIGLGTLLAACGPANDRPALTTGAPGDVVQLTTPTGTSTIQPSDPAEGDIVALLDHPKT